MNRSHVEPGAEARGFAALANPVRLDIVRELAATGEVCGCGFRILGRVSQPTVSHHLRVLREAGLVTAHREASFVHYHLDRDALERLVRSLEGIVEAAAGTQAAGAEDATPCCGPPQVRESGAVAPLPR